MNQIRQQRPDLAVAKLRMQFLRLVSAVQILLRRMVSFFFLSKVTNFHSAHETNTCECTRQQNFRICGFCKSLKNSQFQKFNQLKNVTGDSFKQPSIRPNFPFFWRINWLKTREIYFFVTFLFISTDTRAPQTPKRSDFCKKLVVRLSKWDYRQENLNSEFFLALSPKNNFLLSVQSVLRHFVVNFCSHFQKWITGFQTCRTALIRYALESTDLGAFDDGSNVEIRPIGPDFVTFDVIKLKGNWICNWQKSQQKPFSWQLKHFKWSDFEVWPIVGCTSVSNLQSTLQSNLFLKTKQKYWIWSKIRPQSPKKWVMSSFCILRVPQHHVDVKVSFRTRQVGLSTPIWHCTLNQF